LKFTKGYKRMSAQKGQSTVEYILLVTAVTLVIILFTTGHGPGTFQDGLNQVFNETTGDMLNVASYLQVNAANGT
jgi:Flp pilus assembly pilin Flp